MSYPQQGWQQPQYQPQQPRYQLQDGGAPAYGQQYAASPQPGYAPQTGWGNAPQMPQPGPQYMPQPGGLQCRICGCMPAADTTFRGHQGIIIIMRFLHVKGPFCRDCGMSTYRRMTANTLVQGWWGYASSIITPITVLINLVRRGKVANLPAPMPPPDGRHGQPLDPGNPLYARAQFWIGLCIPFAVIFLIILLNVLSATQGSSY